MEFFKIAPVFKDYIWGGHRLENDFGFNTGFEKTAEAWLLSCHKDGFSVVSTGEFKGRTLFDVLNEHPEYIGEGYKSAEDFPIMLKFIDAEDNLSLQVHPGDEYARKVENDNGKTEAWHILDSADGAELILGFENRPEKSLIREAINNETLIDLVKKVKAKKGETFFIPSGTLHAICKGLFIFEIQQSSNTTYRLYDYGRIQSDGSKRPLHIDKALDVINTEPYKPVKVPDAEFKAGSAFGETLVDCDIFTLTKYNISDFLALSCSSSGFNSVVVVSGEGSISGGNTDIPVKKGDSVFIPASFGEYNIKGNLTVLISSSKR